MNVQKIAIILFFIFSGIITAQKRPQFSRKMSSGLLLGKLFDKTSNQPFPYATVTLQNTKGENVTGAMTDENGQFNLKNIAFGTYVLTINFMGYQPLKKKVAFTAKKPMLRFQKLFLIENATDLDEVVVRAENSTFEQKIDRKVINVGKDLIAMGTNAAAVFDNIPSLSVDPQSGALNLRGSNNVTVLINGRPSNMDVATLLRQIPATSIKKVELITNPSAKYTPEGMGGIVNIILQRNTRLGVNGNVNLGVTRGRHFRYNGALNLNSNNGKTNYVINYGYRHSKRDFWGDVTIEKSKNKREILNTSQRGGHQIEAGVEYNLNKQNFLSIFTTHNFSDNESNGHTTIKNKNEAITLDTRTLNKRKGHSQNYELNYRHIFEEEPNHNLEFALTYSRNKSPQDLENKDAINPNDKIQNYTQDIENLRKQTLFNIDYTKEFSSGSKLELGGMLRFDGSSNDAKTTQHTTLGTDGKRLPAGTTRLRENTDFTYKRQIYAAYINYNKDFWDALKAQLGLRFEQYNADATFGAGTKRAPYKDRIFQIYPSAFFTYELTDTNVLQFSYSLRVSRPSIRRVNPIRRWSSPKIIAVGNPNLRPEFTNAYELSYTKNFKKGLLTGGVFYRQVKNSISRVTNTDPNEDEALIMTYANLEGNDRYGVEGIFNYALAPWWRANLTGDLYIAKEKGRIDGELLSITNYRYSFRMSNNIRIDKWRVQLFGMYRGPSIDIQGYRKPMWMISLGGSRSILKGKAMVNVRANDIFRGMRIQFEALKPFPQQGNFNFEAQNFSVGFTYFFGRQSKNKKRKKRTQSGRGDSDESDMM